MAKAQPAQDKNRASRVLAPTSLSALINQKAAHPDSVIYAGGTYLLRNQTSRVFRLPRTVISLHQVEDLQRVTRTERYLEIGAAATLTEIIRVSRQVLPPALLQAIEGLATVQVRNLATLGGNLCVPDRRLDLFPVLLLMEARLEIRGAGRPRWIPLPRLLDDASGPGLAKGEILTRIRIPFRTWDKQMYRKGYPGHSGEGRSFLFCALAETSRDSLSDIRFTARITPRRILRFKTIEAGFIGRKIPVTARDRSSLLEQMTASMEAEEETVPTYERERILRYTRLFLSECGKTGNPSGTYR